MTCPTCGSITTWSPTAFRWTCLKNATHSAGPISVALAPGLFPQLLPSSAAANPTPFPTAFRSVIYPPDGGVV